MNFSLKRFFSPALLVWVACAAAMTGYLVYRGSKAIKFGIDLVGGSYIMLQVDKNDVVKNELSDVSSRLERRLKEEEVKGFSKPTYDEAKQELVFEFEKTEQAKKAEDIFAKELTKFSVASSNKHVTVSVSENKVMQLLKEARESNIHILENRLNSIGLSEIHISGQGDRNIIIELPDVHDPQQAKTMIGKAAVLEFKVVEDMASSKQALLDKYDGDLPDGTTIVPGKMDENGDRLYYLAPSFTTVSGKYFKNAEVSLNGGNFGTEPAVSFEFDQEGGNRFYDLTSENVGETLAIVLDNEVIQAAKVNEAIRHKGQISGRFDGSEASTLAKLLKSGSFKAKVNFIEERQIGPTLGQESINKGIFSGIIGMILLFFFGLFYYRASGLFAFLALGYNVLVVLLILSLMNATLTLPGIAGMILTVGMAIDASILIFEYIRELTAKGKSLRSAVEEGFSGAMYVILDANITTFIVATVLFYFGTGPIKGFAVTMMIGIVSTLVTGLFFLRSLFSSYLRSCKTPRLSL